MKRDTAYKIAIDTMIEKRRKFAFDYHMAVSEIAIKKYERINQAIEILEAEKDHKQLEMEF